MSRTECKLLTYNILHEVPVFHRLEQRLDLISAGIAAERPHVIALQEVSRSTSSGHVGEALCTRANAHCRAPLYCLDYARADGFGEGEYAFEDGLALMSRLDRCAPPQVLKFEAQVRLAAEVGGHRYRLPDDRIAIAARYRLEGGLELEACVTHLTDSRETIEGVPIRLKQAQELVGWFQRTRDSSRPLLLAGDFNDVPDSETIATITAAGFVDLWQSAGTGPGYTNDRNDIDLESPQGSPNQRLDYVFLRPGRGTDFEIADLHLFLDRPHLRPDGGWLWASDHIGVIATLRF